MVSDIYINLPVNDLDNAIEFFTKLGFKFNPQFTDEKGSCMIVGDHIYVMLLVHPFFKTFINKGISDAKENSEVILALTLSSKEDVDSMMKKVIDAGGKEFRDPEYAEWMYGRSFEDLDGHVWELFYMDSSKIEE